MKGKIKKLVAFALATIMVLAMGITAFAEDTSTITIVSPNEGATYTAYKIFDVKTSTVGGEEVASYTRPADKPLSNVPTTLFDVVNNGGEIYYNAKSNVSASALEAFLKTVVSDGDALSSKSTTISNEEGSNVISGLEPGYYYVSSTSGSAAMLRAIAGGNTNITEKNTQSGWGDNGGKKSYRKVWNDTNGNGVEDTGEVTYEEDIFYAIGDTVKYEITYTNAQNFDTVTTDNGDGTTTTTTTKNHQYVVKDEMPTGVTINVNSVTITVTEANGTTHTLTPAANGKAINTYTGTINSNGFDITIPWASTVDAANVEDFHYKNVPAEIKIEYSATITSNVQAGTALTNTVRISPNQLTNTETEKKENKIYTGSLQVRKYDNTDPNTTFENATDTQKLTGAQFVIIKDATYNEQTAQYLKKDTTTGAISWTSDRSEAVTLTTTNGVSEVLNGLDEGTYYLLETVAPVGYNLLDTPTPVTIVTLTKEQIANYEATLNSTTASAEEKAAAAAAISRTLVQYPEIGNKTGTLLPSTGGIGTTIFYVVGGILVVGAGILLITKKRMSKSN